MTNTRKYYRSPWKRISKLLKVDESQAKAATQKRQEFSALICKQFPHVNSATLWLNNLYRGNTSISIKENR